MTVHRSVVPRSVTVTVAIAALVGCSSSNNRAAPAIGSDGGEAGVAGDAGVAVDAGVAGDAGDGAVGALGPDDIDDDLPLPLAAGSAPTPPMGWNSWNSFATSVDEALIDQTADINT
jgi:hypothetical protein